MIYLGTTPVPARKRPFEQSLKQKEESKNDLKLNKPRLRLYSMVELQERIKLGQLPDLKSITQMPRETDRLTRAENLGCDKRQC